MATDRDALDELAKVSRMDAIHPIRHFLYLPTEEQARDALVAIAAIDCETEEPYPIFDTWCVVAQTHVVPTESAICNLRRLFTEIAAEHDGEYDGWEAEVQQPAKHIVAGDA
jgi:hypothetical protein